MDGGFYDGGYVDDLRARAVQAGIEQLERPTPAERVDARMRDGMLARLTGKRWIDRQPLIDQVLFWAVLATCLIGGGLLFVRAVGRWL
ncbi:hypothetical protein [Pseudodonghicola flavimaris]|uniref:Uncharacterized protein n=1 Tax=Pseudodonghicola flavimaris TaxID=3050036 RepID=A0ABT7EW46_9RHOB|nr:hypothetical protein [Pseudodonghicola flavimaris]MDK3016514.1 hypothetical protein [Pseudodonghicola flavimaris]